MSRPFKSDYAHLPSDERKHSHDGERLPTPDSFDSIDEPLYRRPRSTRRKVLLITTCGVICFLALLLPSPLSRFKRLDKPVTDWAKEKFGSSVGESTRVPMMEYGITQRLKIDNDIVHNGTKAIVIASFTQQNVDWIERIPSNWQIMRYFLDDPNPPNGLSVPANRGREAMAYLTYIIEHYDNLPDFMVFTHGHLRSWHQPEPLPLKIRALNLTALAYEDYISLTCGDQMGCETIPYMDTVPEHVNWPGQIGMRGFWNYIMPDVELPRYLSHKCCAQFAVTRGAIQRLTQADWNRIRDPLLGDWDEMHEKYEWAKPHPWAPFPNGIVEVNDWTIGTWYEKFWHIWFGKGPHYCPSIEYCNRVHFRDAIRCDQYSDFSPFDSETWENQVCSSAFDGIDPDDEPDWKKWNILGEDARLRSMKWNRINEDRKFIHRMKEEEKKHPKPPPIPPEQHKVADQLAHEMANKQDEEDRKKHDDEHRGPGNGQHKPGPPPHQDRPEEPGQGVQNKPGPPPHQDRPGGPGQGGQNKPGRPPHQDRPDEPGQGGQNKPGPPPHQDRPGGPDQGGQNKPAPPNNGGNGHNRNGNGQGNGNGGNQLPGGNGGNGNVNGNNKP